MTLPDANKTCESDSFVDSRPRPSLLKKYDIPVEHISYEYLKNCTDGREVEHIIKILRSGEEGSYPDLTNFAEKCLVEICPKSKVLRKEEPALSVAELGKEHWTNVKTDLKEWTEDVKLVDSDLSNESRGTKELSPTVAPIRGGTTGNVVAPGNKPGVGNKTPQVVAAAAASKSVVPRSYAEWDKFDPEEAILRMETDEERFAEEREMNRRLLQADREKQEKKKRANIVEIGGKDSMDDMDIKESDLISAAEKTAHALTEKNKGNECFKANDLVSALAHFTASLCLEPTVVAYTNRALTQFRLDNYCACVTDCDRALGLDPDNAKALFRRASARHQLGDHRAACADLERATTLEPDNRAAHKLMQEVALKMGHGGKASRMRITEVTLPDPGLKTKAKQALQSAARSQPASGSGEARWALNTVRSTKPKYHINEWGLASSMCDCNGEGPAWVHTNTSHLNPPKIIKVGDEYQMVPSGTSTLEKGGVNSKLVEVCDKSAVQESSVSSTLKEGSVSSTPIEGGDSSTVKEGSVSSTVKEGSVNSTPKEGGDSSTVRKECDKSAACDSVRRSGEEKGSIEASGCGKGFSQTLVKEKIVEVEEDSCKSDQSAGDGDGMFFLHKWCTLREDRDLLQHAKLLNSIKPEDLPKVVGAALDEQMLSQLLGCLDLHAELFMPEMRLDYLSQITKVERFTIVQCFMADKDRLVVGNILKLLHDQGVYVPSALKTCLEQR